MKSYVHCRCTVYLYSYAINSIQTTLMRGNLLLMMNMTFLYMYSTHCECWLMYAMRLFALCPPLHKDLVKVVQSHVISYVQSKGFMILIRYRCMLYIRNRLNKSLVSADTSHHTASRIRHSEVDITWRHCAAISVWHRLTSWLEDDMKLLHDVRMLRFITFPMSWYLPAYTPT